MEKVVETKLYFAKAFLKLRQQKGVEQIRVKDLCGNGGASRQTFYYHFLDKNDLLYWMLDYELEKTYRSNAGDYNVPCLEEVLKSILDEDSFFRAILGGKGGYPDITFLSDFFIQYDSKTVKTAFRLAELNKDQQFTVKYYAYAFSGVIINALNSKEPVNPHDLAEEIYSIMPTLMKDAYVKKLDRYY